MQLQFIISAILIGFAGSFHCAGMCGPLMLTSLFTKNENRMPIKTWTIYHSGRIFIYALWGALFGTIGTSMKFFGFQQNISLTLGIAILSIMLMIMIFPSVETKIQQYIGYKHIRNKIFSIAKTLNLSPVLIGGVLNGLLPCGLVYVALAGATTMQDPIHGALFMTFFGIGTLPMLLAVMIIGVRLQFPIRQYLTKWYPVIIIVMAMLLILRGMNQGNFMSPSLLIGKNEKIHCMPE